MSFSDHYVTPGEEDGQAVVHVRRSGGSAGDVSVDYRDDRELRGDCRRGLHGGIRHACTGPMATSTEREIVVAVADDDDPPKTFESFHVALSDVVGGAGIGTRNATIDIKPDGEPGGQIAIDYVEQVISEDRRGVACGFPATSMPRERCP